MTAEEARANEENERIRDEAVVSRGRALMRDAKTAASANDCKTVEAIEQQVLALPDAHLQGGFHDTIFINDTEIVRCLAERRHFHDMCRTAPTPECELSRAQSREECVLERNQLFDRILSDPPDQRKLLLGTIEVCPTNSTDDGVAEQTWMWTKGAAINALNGHCALALDLQSKVATLDSDRYDLVFSAEPDIARCLAAATQKQQDAAQKRQDYERCKRDRIEAQRRAQQISDVSQRGKALSALPVCSPPADNARR